MRYFWLGILVSTMMLAACGDDNVTGTESGRFVTGTMTDSRDGQTYKTVTIGTQTWMAENLNFETKDSYCCNDFAEYCTKYGRLYTWMAAMDGTGTWTTNGKGCGYYKTCTPTYPVRGVCPEGWHLPSRAEFESLFNAVGGESVAAKMLKSTSGWNVRANSVSGTDAYSFSALAAGERYGQGEYDHEGNFAYFWSSTEDDSLDAYSMKLDHDCGNAALYANRKNSGFSVRCVKD